MLLDSNKFKTTDASTTNSYLIINIINKTDKAKKSSNGLKIYIGNNFNSKSNFPGITSA